MLSEKLLRDLQCDVRQVVEVHDLRALAAEACLARSGQDRSRITDQALGSGRRRVAAPIMAPSRRGGQHAGPDVMTAGRLYPAVDDRGRPLRSNRSVHMGWR
jgi:hypothetical protein